LDGSMDLFDISMVGLQRGMSGALLRQQVLANNLAMSFASESILVCWAIMPAAAE